MINLKLRLKNKVVLIAIITWIVTFVYFILSGFGITPKFSGAEVLDWILKLLDVLVLLGVVADPTTKGIKDSPRAMNYDSPAPTVINKPKKDIAIKE